MSPFWYWYAYTTAPLGMWVTVIETPSSDPVWPVTIVLNNPGFLLSAVPVIWKSASSFELTTVTGTSFFRMAAAR